MLEEVGRLADFAPGKTVTSSPILGDEGFVPASGSHSLGLAIDDVGDVASSGALRSAPPEAPLRASANEF